MSHKSEMCEPYLKLNPFHRSQILTEILIYQALVSGDVMPVEKYPEIIASLSTADVQVIVISVVIIVIIIVVMSRPPPRSWQAPSSPWGLWVICPLCPIWMRYKF